MKTTTTLLLASMLAAAAVARPQYGGGGHQQLNQPKCRQINDVVYKEEINKECHEVVQ